MNLKFGDEKQGTKVIKLNLKCPVCRKLQMECFTDGVEHRHTCMNCGYRKIAEMVGGKIG